MGHDLSPIQQLVQMGTAHSQPVSHLRRSERRIRLQGDHVDALTYAATYAQQHIAHLWRHIPPRDLVEHVGLATRNGTSTDGRHSTLHIHVTDATDVTDDSSG